MRKIVLASSSPYKKQQLRTLGIDFDVATTTVNESILPNENACNASQRLATLKAKAVINAYTDTLIIGSDQTAELGTMILGKPGTEEQAFRQLSHSSGQTVTFYSAITLFNTSNSQYQCQVTTTKVQFRKLSSAEINAYLEKEYVLNCAGSFKAEALGISLFHSVSSQDPSALIGLPLIALNHMLLDAGVNLLG